MIDIATSINAIAFDLDDTLYDEAEWVDACLHNVADYCAAHWSDVTADEVYADLRCDATPYDGLAAGAMGTRMSLEQMLDIYRSTQPEALPLRSDATALLDWLHASRTDIALYLITDGRIAGQSAKIKALGLEKYFTPEHIIISDAIGGDKKTQLPFATAMERQGNTSGWMYIGDNLAKDFYWPRRMGWLTAMVRDCGRNVHPQHLDTTPADYRPDITIDSLTEIINLLSPKQCQQH